MHAETTPTAPAPSPIRRQAPDESVTARAIGVHGDRSRARPTAYLRDGLFSRLIAGAQSAPEHPLFHFLGPDGRDGAQLTTGALHARASQLAGALRTDAPLTAPLVAGDRVLLMYQPGPAFVVALLGCMWAELIPVPIVGPNPLDLRGWLGDVQRIFDDCGARAVLTEATLRRLRGRRAMARARGEGRFTWVDAPWIDTDALRSAAAPRAIARPPTDAIAFIQYTSGSTGDPKGVALSYGNLCHQLECNYSALDLRLDDRPFLWLPHHHDFGLVSGILSNLGACATLYLMAPMHFVQDPTVWLRTIDRVRATQTAAPDFAYRAVLDAISDDTLARLDLSCLRMAMSAAEPIRARTMTPFLDRCAAAGLDRRAFCPAYGLAENTVGVTAGGRGPRRFDAEALSRGQAIERADGAPIWSCGPPLPGVDVRVVDPQTHAARAPGVVGEVWVDSPSKSVGYWGRPALSAERLDARLADAPNGVGYLRTGDLGFLLDGELFITGRRAELIIVRGRNIYPADVEATLRDVLAAHGVERVFAFSATLDGAEAVCVAAEQRTVDDPPATALPALAQAAREAISRRHQIVIDRVILTEPGALPYGSSGKPRRRACAAALVDGTLPIVAEQRGPAPHRAPDAGFESIEARVGEGFSALARRKRGRATHTVGVAASGTFTFADDLSGLPRHPQLVPGQVVPAVLRHASIKGFNDDAVLDGRGASLRLLLDDGAHQDLIMSTGERFFRADAATFGEWFAADLDARAAIVKREPRIAEIVAEIFADPASFTDVPYFTQTAFTLAGIDGETYIVKLRLAADHARPHPVAEERLQIPLDYVPRAPDDPRPADYLRAELRRRLEGEPIGYTLAMQWRRAQTDDLSGPDGEAMDCTRPWPETERPWHAVGRLMIDAPLDADEADKVAFQLASPGGFLTVPTVDNPHHPGSINTLRQRVYARSARARREAAGAATPASAGEYAPAEGKDTALTLPPLPSCVPTTPLPDPETTSLLFAELGRRAVRCSADLPFAERVEHLRAVLAPELARYGVNIDAVIAEVLERDDCAARARRMRQEILDPHPPIELQATLREIGAVSLDWYNHPNRAVQRAALERFCQVFPEPAFRTSTALDRYAVIGWERARLQDYFGRLTFLDKPHTRTRMMASPYFAVKIDDDRALMIIRASTAVNLDDRHINDMVCPINEFIFVLGRDSGVWQVAGVHNSRSDHAPDLPAAEQAEVTRRWIAFADAREEPEAFVATLQNNLFTGLLLEALFRGLVTHTQRAQPTPGTLPIARRFVERRPVRPRHHQWQRIGVIGAGPSGLSCAHYLRAMGYRDVSIFERDAHPGGKSATWYHEGRPYDLGAHVITTEHGQHPHLLELLAEYGVELEPVTPYYAFDDATHAVSAMAPGPDDLARITAVPGFETTHQPDGRARALAYDEGAASWLQRHGLDDTPFTLPYVASGYGYIEDSTPAGHLVKLIEMSSQNTELAKTPAAGFQAIWDRIAASFGARLHLESPVRRVERRADGQVTLHIEGGASETFDAVIICAPPTVTRRLLGDSAQRSERALFDRVRSIRYFTVVCEIAGLPRRGFYLVPRACADSAERGRVVAFHHRHAESDIYTLYAYGDPEQTTADIMRTVAEHVAEMGGTVVQTHVEPIEWAYAPHFEPDDLALGALDRLEGLQGLRGVYHTSALRNFELVDCCVESARDLVHRHFGVPTEAPLWAQATDALAPTVEVKRATRADLEQMLRDRIGQASGDGAHAVNLRAPIETLGLESITLFQLVGELGRMLGQPLSPQVLADYPDFASLLDHAMDGTLEVDAQSDGDAPDRAPTDGADRVTLSQRAFAEQARSLPAAFENLFAFDVPSSLAPAAIADALSAVARRHPGLRTVDAAGRLMIVEALSPTALAEVRAPLPLSDLPQQLAAAAGRGLDLGQSAVRWRLLSGAGRAVLLMRISHLTYDARSMPRVTASLNAALGHVMTHGVAPDWPLVWPDPAFIEAERAYLGSAARATDRAFWRAEGPELPAQAPLDPSTPLIRVPRTPVGAAERLAERARHHRSSANSALLWAFGHAAADVIGVDALPLGFAVDLRALYGTTGEVPCAVLWVPVGFDRDLRPATLHARVLKAASHARLPNAELREACGFDHIHPRAMFFSYVDFTRGARPAPPPADPILKRIDTADLPVQRPNLLQGFARLAGDAVLFDARTRVGADVLAERMAAALRRL